MILDLINKLEKLSKNLIIIKDIHIKGSNIILCEKNNSIIIKNCSDIIIDINSKVNNISIKNCNNLDINLYGFISEIEVINSSFNKIQNLINNDIPITFINSNNNEYYQYKENIKNICFYFLYINNEYYQYKENKNIYSCTSVKSLNNIIYNIDKFRNIIEAKKINKNDISIF